MIEAIKYATISSIYIKELIFYNKRDEVKLMDFCKNNGISHLPDVDRKNIYKLTENGFVKVPLSQDLICHPFDRLFSLDTIKKFENGDHDEVLFVVEEEIIKGVVHIVDYNNDFLNIEFYKASYMFERMLRSFLLKKEEDNQSLLAWMKMKSKKHQHWEDRYKQCMPSEMKKREKEMQKRKDFKPFQTFFLNDLLMFSASKGYVSSRFKQNIEGVKQVRNWVAHSKDLTFKSTEVGKPLYKIDELKNFIQFANQFFQCYEELEFESFKK